jgi:4'-phosphopantetheinyl transferase EntD
MIEALLPATVVTVESREDLPEDGLFPVEEEALGRAVDVRRREFATGRACARRALRQLGHAEGAIPAGARGEPLWPGGIAGSITHCTGYRAAAVAFTTDVASLGIDAEPHEPLPDGALDSIASPLEQQRLRAAPGGIHADRLLFSAKEAVYKAWFPIAQRWLGFEDVDLEIDFRKATFDARLLVPGPRPGGAPLRGFHGRWTVRDDLVLAAVIVRPPEWTPR